jgi:hypothetical protein
VLLAGIVAVAARWERRTLRGGDTEASATVVGAGVVACLVGLTGLGVGGPDGMLPAVAGVPVGEGALFTVGLALVGWGGDNSHARRGGGT